MEGRVVVVLFSWLAAVLYADDNYVLGQPEVECGPSSISVNWHTNLPFEGTVFVKGQRDTKECTSIQRGRHVAGIEVPFDSCNLARTRSLNPKGIYVALNVVLAFHPLFITMIDKAYRIECFYMDSDQFVQADVRDNSPCLYIRMFNCSPKVGVAEMSTALITSRANLPSCKYEIRKDGPTGAAVSRVSVGERHTVVDGPYNMNVDSKVYHHWSCDTDTVDTFCMAVHTCTVEDGAGQTVPVLDSEGCSLDPRLLADLEYSSDLSAGQINHVYKYADKEQIFYQCQISITVKEPGAECPHPICMIHDKMDVTQGPPMISVGNDVSGEMPSASPYARSSRSNDNEEKSISRVTRSIDKGNMSMEERTIHVLDVRTGLTAVEMPRTEDVGSSEDPVVCLSPLATTLVLLPIMGLFTGVFIVLCIHKSSSTKKSSLP